MLTRLGEAGADAFTIMKIAGHSSITMSQRYVHPTAGQVDRTIERLETGGTGVNRGTAVDEDLTKASGGTSTKKGPTRMQAVTPIFTPVGRDETANVS
jgi:hypothetical protein